VEYTGRHHGYERFEPPVTHERTFRLTKQDGSLSVIDRLTGHGTHDVRWHFHLAPGVGAELAESGAVLLSAAGRRWRLQLPSDLPASISDAAYSPSYGVKLRCLAIDAGTRFTFDGTATWCFSFSQ